MTLKKVLYRTRVHIAGSWKKALMMHPLLRVVFISLLPSQFCCHASIAVLPSVLQSDLLNL